MRRDRNLPEEGYSLGRLFWRHCQAVRDHVLAFLRGELHEVLKHNLVHRATKVHLDLIHDVGLVNVLALEELILGSHGQNSELLLGVEFMEPLLRHAVDVKVVADLRVGVNALTVGLSNTLCEDARVLRVEEQIDALEPHIVCGAVPLAGVALGLLVVAIDEDWPPGTQAVFVLEETLAWDWNKCAVLLLTIRDPLFGLAAVVLGVIEELKWQPVFLIL